MKKITLLFFLLAASFGFSQPTTDAPTPPARNAGDVIAIYGDNSGSYTNISGIDYAPYWGQPAGWIAPNPSFDPGSGNLVLFYDDLNYQGLDFSGNPQDASTMEFLHVDIWTTSTETIAVTPINPGDTPTEILVNITTNPGGWSSVDIPKSSFTGMTWNNVIQFKFEVLAWPSVGTADVYIDNLYFWKNPVDPNTDATLSDLQMDGATISGFSPAITDYTYEVPFGTTIVPQITLATPTEAGLGATASITQASGIPGDATVLVTAANGTTTETYTVSIVAVGPGTPAPTPPNRPAADVKSIFSDAYTDAQSIVSVDTFDTPWCPGTTSDVTVDGNATKKVTGLGCEGVEFITGRFDATTFTHFHMDIYTDTDTQDKSFNVKFSNWNGGGGEANALEYSVNNGNFLTNPNPGTWISLDIPLDDFTAITNADRNDFVQFVITSDLGTVYYDNLYLHKNTVLGTDEFEATEFNVYPNPTNNVWNVKSSQTIESVLVYDLLGKQVISLEGNSNEAQIDASVLPAGLYFAKITTELGTNSIKLIKQ